MPRKIHAKDEIEGTQLRRNALAIYEKLVAEDPPVVNLRNLLSRPRP